MKRGSNVAVLVGVVGGAAIFFGVMVWYFAMVDRRPPPMPDMGRGTRSNGAKPAAAESEDLVMETGALDIVPLSELHVKIKSGKALSVEVSKDSGLTAKVESNAVTITAAKEAKGGRPSDNRQGRQG